MLMDKKYIITQYKLAISDFRIATTDEQKWNARKEMANWERTAMELYGFDFADSLHYLKQNSNLLKQEQ